MYIHTELCERWRHGAAAFALEPQPEHAALVRQAAVGEAKRESELAVHVDDWRAVREVLEAEREEAGPQLESQKVVNRQVSSNEQISI